MIDTARPPIIKESLASPDGGALLPRTGERGGDGRLSLSAAARETVYRVAAIEGRDDHACRLLEMGFAIGIDVVVVRAGDPAIVQVGRTRLAMSRACLCRVTVVPASDAAL